MARLDATKSKKSSRKRTEVSPLKRSCVTFAEQRSRGRELPGTAEQQTATSDILRVIAGSPTELQPVLDAVAESAARLCDATDVLIDRVDGDVLEHVAAMVLCQWRKAGGPSVERRPPAERLSTARRFTFTMSCYCSIPSTRKPKPVSKSRYSNRSRYATPSRRSCHRQHSDSPNRSSSLHGKTDRSPQNLCRSGGHRH